MDIHFLEQTILHLLQKFILDILSDMVQLNWPFCWDISRYTIQKYPLSLHGSSIRSNETKQDQLNWTPSPDIYHYDLIYL